jgi:hypothetical protein
METLCSNRKGEFKSLSGLALDILVLAAAQGRNTSLRDKTKMATISFPTPSPTRCERGSNDYSVSGDLIRFGWHERSSEGTSFMTISEMRDLLNDYHARFESLGRRL